MITQNIMVSSKNKEGYPRIVIKYPSLPHFSLETPKRVTGSADPIQTLQDAAPDQCLHCLQTV